RLRQQRALPRAIALVLADRHEQRMLRPVAPGADGALQSLLVGPLEVTQALRPVPGDPDVPVARRDDVLAPLRADRRQLQLLAEHLRQLVERHVHFEQVLGRLVARPLAAPLLLARSEDRAYGAVPLPDAPLLLLSEEELRDVDLRKRDGDEVLAAPPDQLAAADVALQVLLDAPADNLAEAVVVLVDAENHAGVPIGSAP